MGGYPVPVSPARTAGKPSRISSLGTHPGGTPGTTERAPEMRLHVSVVWTQWALPVRFWFWPVRKDLAFGMEIGPLQLMWTRDKQSKTEEAPAMRGPMDNTRGREMHQDQINHQRIVAQLLQIYDRAPCRSCGASRLDCSKIRERGGDDAIVECCFPTCDHSIAPGKIHDLIRQVEFGQVREPKPEAKRKRPRPVIPLPPGVVRWLTTDEAVEVIVAGDHPEVGAGSLGHDVALIELLRTGRVLAARLSDGRLAFTTNEETSMEDK